VVVVAALDVIKRRGLLHQHDNLQAGRARDKSLAVADDPAPHIKLEYLNESGRSLKPKEAFRHLSHIFHKKGPSTMKAEKRLKRRREEDRIKAISSEDTPMWTSTKLKEAQKKTGQAYVVLDKKFTIEERERQVEVAHNIAINAPRIKVKKKKKVKPKKPKI